MTARLLVGDCRDVLATLEAASIDAVITDPPYGLEFMGKDWDRLWNRHDGDETRSDGRTARKFQTATPQYKAGATAQSWHETWAREVYRVLKPGAFLLSFGGDRTIHRMICAVEDAGFEIRGQLAWIHGQGFPKNLDVSKALRNGPVCRCDAVDTIPPASLIGASVGTEPRTMPLTGIATDETGGLGLEMSPSPLGRQGQVDGEISDLGGQLGPIMLGSSHMTVMAESNEIVDSVGLVEADPEPLRDQMMRNELVTPTAIGTDEITSDDALGDYCPPSALIPPLSTAPGGIPLTTKADAIVGSHAVSGAVDSTISPSSAFDTAGFAGVDSVSFTDDHTKDYTTERQALTKCPRCGLLIKESIPDGIGTALKPAMELICLARKPLAAPNVAANVTAWGVGGLNIDGCRIAHTSAADRAESEGKNQHTRYANPGSNRDSYSGDYPPRTDYDGSLGRWPANLILDAESAAVLDEMSGERAGGGNSDGLGRRTNKPGESFQGNLYELGLKHQPGSPNYSDSGGASRFFYTSKASRRERSAGLPDGMVNDHPTVKPLSLCNWLVRLICPPNGVILDPFAGSGSVGCAAVQQGFNFIGVDLDEHYVAIAESRITYWAAVGLRQTTPSRRADRSRRRVCDTKDITQLSLLDDAPIPDRSIA